MFTDESLRFSNLLSFSVPVDCYFYPENSQFFPKYPGSDAVFLAPVTAARSPVAP